MIKNWFQSLVAHPEVRGAGIDDPATVIRHARIISRKPFLRELYAEWYQMLQSFLPHGVPGAVVELGSGGGFIREVIPEALNTDVQPVDGLGTVMDATALPFRRRSLKAVVMVDVLHHLPRVASFFRDASRCVNSGGVIAMIEPWNTSLSRFFYRYFHREPFDPTATDWGIAGAGPMSRSNQALPWILFQRDRIQFQKLFPQWELRAIHLHTPFRYVLSGGVSYRGLMPVSTFRFWRSAEKKLKGCMRCLALFAIIILVRKSSDRRALENG